MQISTSSRQLRGWLALGLIGLVFLALLGMTVRWLYRELLTRQQIAVPMPPRDIPNTDLSPFGANFFLAREVEPWKIDKTLQLASEAGIVWVKQQFPWAEIEPERKGEFLVPGTKESTWAKYDRIVASCEKYGLKIIARLDRPPDWSRQDNTYKERPPDRFEDYGDFVYAFVDHYKGRIDYIQIWNEPNIFPEWGNQPVDPEAYVTLLKIAYTRAKEANPNVYVLSAPLAMTLGQPHPEPGKWISMNDLDFLEAMYQAGAADYFDILSANAFGMDRPPEDPPDPNVLNFQRVLLTREIMERHGDANKAIWFNEYGWNAAPETFPAEKLIWRRVSEKKQAEYTLRGIQLARQEWPWAGAFMIWYFRQVGNIRPDDAEYYFRMVDPDFTPRQVYFAIQDVACRQHVVGPGTFEETNPAVRTFGHWTNVIDKTAMGRSFIRSEIPGDSLMFRGYGVDLVTHRWAGAGRIWVSMDGHTVPGLPVDDQGLSYVDLYSPTPQAQSRLPLVRDAGPGEHTLRLTVSGKGSSEGGECTVDGFVVLAQPREQFPIIQLLGLLAGLGASGIAWWRTWRRMRWLIRRQ